MKSESHHPELNESLSAALVKFFARAERQFGKAIKTYRFHNEERCPGCGRRIDFMKVNGENAMSVNGFLYRERGVLISYLLCDRCARQIQHDARENPGVETTLHDTIEQTLIKAYLRTLN